VVLLVVDVDVVDVYSASCTNSQRQSLRKYSLSLVNNVLKHVQKTQKSLLVCLSTEHPSICNHVRQFSCEAPPSNRHTKLRTCAHIAYTRSSKMRWS